MNKLDKDYQALLQDILDNGVTKEDRTGTGTLSVFGRQIRHKMSDGFPALTTKKLAFKTMTTELLWFLRGSSDIRFLWQNNCKIWDGDWYKSYCNSTSSPYSLDEMKEFALKNDTSFHESEWNLGPIYGKQWRDWNGRKTDGFVEYENNGYSNHIKGIDQIQDLISELKTNPDSRRLMVNAWNVGELHEMTLPPCHYGFQVYTRELSEEERIGILKRNHTEIGHHIEAGFNFLEEHNIPTRAISLMWNQRSVDTFLGLPFNIASYGLLLEIIAKEVNMVPDELIGNLGDTHLYSNHIEQAKEQISREPMKLTKLLFKDHLNDFDSIIDILRVNDFVLDDYQSHPAIKAPLSN